MLYVTNITPHDKATRPLKLLLGGRCCQSTAAAYAAQINAFVDAPHGIAWHMYWWGLFCLVVPLLSLS